MRKLSLLMAIVMLFSVVSVAAFAEEAPALLSSSGFWYIEETDTQARLSATDKDLFFSVDGLWFKDLNKNGALDAYEDWRLPVEERVADLLAQMTPQEKAGTLGFGGIGGKNGITVTNMTGVSTGTTGTAFMVVEGEQMDNETDGVIYVDNVLYTPVAYQIKVMNETTMIAAMTGLPYDQLCVLNKIQSIAETNRLGIPVVFSGDRTYNTWGGMIDAPHYAFGIARDPDLLYDLMSEYAKESVAIGYHQVFHGYGNEIGSWYGDDPAYIALMAATETRAYEDNGFNSHSKHFIARGGRNSYTAARSPADLIDSWKIGWQAVVDAGTQWVMTNNNVGVTGGTLQTYMDKETYKILRDELGYEGIICLDWPLSATSILTKTGITADGIDVSTLTLEERYALILNVGIDMFSCYGEIPGLDPKNTDLAALNNYYLPDVVVQAVEDGLVTEEDFNIHVGRVLKNKFDQKLFEDPYSDWEDALALIGNEQYQAEWADVLPLSNADIDMYRRQEIIDLEEQLMVESTIILKNDNDVLPLKAGVKLYVEDATKSTLADDLAALGAVIVDEIEAADVVVTHVTSFNDAFELICEDAADAGKPVVTIYEGTNSSEPALAQFKVSAALIMQTYRNTPDHGSSVGSFYRYATAAVTADMLFGVQEPTGKTLFELGYESTAKTLSWGELQDDIGVSPEVRLYMAMLAKTNPAVDMPNNLGDVIVTTDFGIEYSKPADIELSLLTLPSVIETVTTENNGRVRTSTVVSKTAKPGEAFTIYFVAMNNGGDGMVTVDVLVNGEVAAQKLVGVTADQFRVIPVSLTLDAGEYEITVADMTNTIVIK